MEVGVPTEATEFAVKSAEMEQRQKQEPAPIQYHNMGEPDALDPVLSRPTATRRDAQVKKIHKIINHILISWKETRNYSFVFTSLFRDCSLVRRCTDLTFPDEWAIKKQAFTDDGAISVTSLLKVIHLSTISISITVSLKIGYVLFDNKDMYCGENGVIFKKLLVRGANSKKGIMG